MTTIKKKSTYGATSKVNPAGRDYCAIALKYARDVVAGKIPACKWTIAACQRQLNDLKKPPKGYRFDKSRAALMCRAAELFPHVKGKEAGKRKNLVLEPWQIFIYTTVFGWIDREGNRRFRIVYIEVPRKNGKSTFTSPVGLYMAFMEGEVGADVYSAATTRDQAKIVFKDAQAMARATAEFLKRFGVEVRAHNINQVSSNSKFEALSSEAGTQDGLNVHAALIDELHAHKTRELYDVIETAIGARAQPLLWLITTAGSNRAGICYEQRTYVTKILDGVVADERYFGIIYTIDDGDDWTDPASWAKANPNLGVSINPETIASLCAKAMQMAAAVNNFLTKHLNVWVNADTAWMDMRAWDRCADPTLNIADFEGETCFEGDDLASKTDIAARMRLFRRTIDGKEHYYAFGQYYLPQAAVEESRNSQYSGWELEGRLITTPGDVLDFSRIEQDILDDSKTYQIQEWAFDPWQATQLSQRLGEEGMLCVEVRNTVANFSSPMKEIDALVRDGRFHHDGDPVLAWMVSNVVCHTDAKDNIYPRKERPENKIDGVIALITALNRAMHAEGSPMKHLDDFLANPVML